MSRAQGVFISVIAAATGAQAPAASPSFQGLGMLFPDHYKSEAYDVSADGRVVVGSSVRYEVETIAVRWVDGVSESLGTGTPLGVSADGTVVVGQGNSRAFRWTAETGMVTLGNSPSGFTWSQADAISGDGTVIVGRGYIPSSPLEAFIWTEAAGMVGLGDLSGGMFQSWAHGVSWDGSVIVGSGHSASGPEGFRWVNGVMSGIGDLPGGIFSSGANSVSADGSVVVGHGRSGNGPEASRWENDVMVGLGDLPGGRFRSFARDVSADGSIIVGTSATHFVQDSNAYEAFIWDEVHGMRDLRTVLEDDYGLDLTGWLLDEARAVSANGLAIVGYGDNPSGRTEAWLARLDQPTPAVLTSAVSRKTHETVGDFDIELPLDGESATECRLGGATEIILTFDQPVRGNGGSITCANVSVEGAFACQSVEGSGSDTLTIHLVGVTNNACLTLTLDGITAVDGGLPLTGDNDIHIQVRRGDVDGDDFVGLSDLAEIKAELFQPVTPDNFRRDVDHDGFIGLEDLASTKTNLFQGTRTLCAP